MSGQLFGIILVVLVALILLKYIAGFIFTKKIRIHDHELFIIEINKKKKEAHQVLLIFSNGYWEIKEEAHSKEWSIKFGSQNYVDLDTEIDDKRYYKIMNETLERDKEGHHSLSIKKEIDLKPNTNPSELLKV